MARFLFCTLPIAGHVDPGLPIARALIAGGHTVWWYTGRRFQSAVEATGARYAPMRAAPDFDDRDLAAAFPGASERTGLAALKFGMKRIFFDAAPGQVEDLRHILNVLDRVVAPAARIGDLLQVIG